MNLWVLAVCTCGCHCVGGRGGTQNFFLQALLPVLFLDFVILHTFCVSEDPAHRQAGQRLLWALDGWCSALDPNWGHCDPGELGLWDLHGILDRWVIRTVSEQLVVPRQSSGFPGWSWTVSASLGAGIPRSGLTLRNLYLRSIVWIVGTWCCDTTWKSTILPMYWACGTHCLLSIVQRHGYIHSLIEGLLAG